MGYIRGLVHGALVGTVVGICIAPQPGSRTRQQLSGFGAAAKDGIQVAERTVRKVAPFVGAAAEVAKHQVEKARHDDEDSYGDAAAVRIHNETNGRH